MQQYYADTAQFLVKEKAGGYEM